MKITLLHQTTSKAGRSAPKWQTKWKLAPGKKEAIKVEIMHLITSKKQ